MDDFKLTKEQQRMVKEVAPLIFHIANRITFRKPEDKEDVIQDCRLLLCKAVKCFDPNRGVKFSTYAHKTISNHIMEFKVRYETPFTLPHMHGANNLLALKQPDWFSLDSNELFEERLGDLSDSNNIEYNPDTNNKSLEMIRKRIKFLQDEERYVLDHTFGLNGAEILTKREIGKRLNRSGFFANCKLEQLYKRFRRWMNLTAQYKGKSAKEYFYYVED